MELDEIAKISVGLLGFLVFAVFFALLPDICAGLTRMGNIFTAWLEIKFLGRK